jgi:hypothetical protein
MGRRRGDRLMARGRYEIHHVQLDLVLDVARRDLGHPEVPGLWPALRSQPIHPGELRCLICQEEGRGLQWVYLRDLPIRHPVHFTTTIKTHGFVPKTDEHLALQERVAASAEQRGLTARIEARSADGSHVSDVLIHGGGVELGFEAQLSAEDRQKTRRRNTARVKAGIQPMWVGTNENAKFVDAVPWAAIPRQGALYIAAGEPLRVTGGVQRLVLERCGFDGDPCPRSRKRSRATCTGRHLYPELIRPDLDTLVIGAATGLYRSLHVRGTTRDRFWWVTDYDYQRWMNDRGPYAQPQTATGQPNRSRPPEHHSRPAATTCTECRTALHPAAAAGGFTTHPDCDPGADTSAQLRAHLAWFRKNHDRPTSRSR